VKRPYLFEIVVLANLALVAIVARGTAFLLGDIVRTLIALFLALLAQAAIGIVVRVIVSLVRGNRGYVRRLRRRGWALDTLRLTLGVTLMTFGYGWLKLAVPLLRDPNFDPELWDLDRMVALGIAPSEFLLNLFRGASLRVVDWTYANIFYASMIVAMAFFLSHPSRRLRIAFFNGNTLLWIMGVWLYFLVPSVGPAYRFPEIWFRHSEDLPITQGLQAALMRNWLHARDSWEAGRLVAPVSIAFGIAAFPSLHVAFQTYVFLWMRRLWLSGQVLFGVFAFTIFLGSMITGWHYLVDGIAGIVMAYAAYRMAIRPGSRLFFRA
jgi:hypothetical protein